MLRIINPEDFPEAAPSDKVKIEYFDMEEGLEEPILRIGKGGIEKSAQ